MNAGHPPGFALIDNKEVFPLSNGSCPVGFFNDMKIEKDTLTYQDDIQILLFTDGVMEALDTNEADGLVQLRKAVSKKWLTCREDAPIDLVLPKHLQIDQPDDMCVVLIQAN